MSEQKWQVGFTYKASKQYKKLPKKVQLIVDFLALSIEKNGPVRGDWAHYSKLDKIKHHCHLRGGRPTYVACWEVVDKKVKIVEIYYVGTHEKAPY